MEPEFSVGDEEEEDCGTVPRGVDVATREGHPQRPAAPFTPPASRACEKCTDTRRRPSAAVPPGRRPRRLAFSTQEKASDRLTTIYQEKRAAPRNQSKAARIQQYGAMQFREYATEWRAGQRDLAESSVRTLESLLGHHILPALGSRRMSAFDHKVVDGFIRTMERNGAGLATQYNAFDNVKSVLLDAYRLGTHTENPVPGVKPPQHDAERAVIPSPTQLRDIRTAGDDRFLLIAGEGYNPFPILDGSDPREGFVRFTAKMLKRSQLGQAHADATRELAEELVPNQVTFMLEPGYLIVNQRRFLHGWEALHSCQETIPDPTGGAPPPVVPARTGRCRRGGRVTGGPLTDQRVPPCARPAAEHAARPGCGGPVGCHPEADAHRASPGSCAELDARLPQRVPCRPGQRSRRAGHREVSCLRYRGQLYETRDSLFDESDPARCTWYTANGSGRARASPVPRPRSSAPTHASTLRSTQSDPRQ